MRSPRENLLLSLARAELEPTPFGLAVGVAANREDGLARELERLANGPPPDPLELAKHVKQNVIEKFDPYLGADLLTLAFAGEHLDVQGLPLIAAELLSSLRQ